MKKLLLVCLFLSALPAFGQGSVYSTTIFNRIGQAVANASFAVCTAEPTGDSLCQGTSLATTYEDITLGTPCTNVSTATGPTSGTGCTNPGLSDSLGNVNVFSTASVRWAQISGYLITAQTLPIAFPATSTSSVAFNSITAGTNTQALRMGTGGTLFPTGTGQIRSTAIAPYSTAQTAPSPLATLNCPSGDPVWGYFQNAAGNYQDQFSVDETTSHGAVKGKLNLGCWGLDFNDSGIAPIAGNNNYINIYHTWGNGGVQAAGTNGAAVSIFTISNGSQTDFGGSGQLVNLYAENRMVGDPIIPIGPEPGISVIRGTFSDERTGATHILSGGGGGLAAFSANYELHTNQGYGSCASGACAQGFLSIISAGSTPVATGNHNSDLLSSYTARRDFGASTATNVYWAGYLAMPTGTRFATGNYAFYSGDFGTNAADSNILSVGVNSAGTASGFNQFYGPISTGNGATHAASGYQIDSLGAVKIKAGAGVRQLDLFGSTSGSCGLSTDATSTAFTSTCALRAPDGAVGAPGFSFASDTDTGFYRTAANIFRAAVGGAEVAAFANTGLDVTGQVSATTQLISTVSTGTAPIVVSSSTTIPTMTVSNHPKVFACGTTTTCSATAQTSAIITQGRVTLSAGTATVSSLPAYTSTSSFHCSAQDTTSTATSANAVPASTTSITVTGTASDVIDYLCVGN